MPSLENKILFLEADSIKEGNCVAEFDPDLQSVIHQPYFHTVKALVLGRFEKKFCMDFEKLKFIIKTKPELNNIPIIANADFGHTTPIFTFPIGGMCELEATSGSISIKLLEHSDT